MTRRVLIALGSNLGDRLTHLRAAVVGLPGVVAESGVYETEPVGGPHGQGPYLNAVVALETDWPARRLLAAGQALELERGRRPGPRGAARPLDVDIVWIDGETHDESDLTVPHPRAAGRAFVLVPLADVAADVARQLAPGGPPAGPVIKQHDAISLTVFP